MIPEMTMQIHTSPGIAARGNAGSTIAAMAMMISPFRQENVRGLALDFVSTFQLTWIVADSNVRRMAVWDMAFLSSGSYVLASVAAKPFTFQPPERSWCVFVVLNTEH